MHFENIKCCHWQQKGTIGCIGRASTFKISALRHDLTNKICLALKIPTHLPNYLPLEIVIISLPQRTPLSVLRSEWWGDWTLSSGQVTWPKEDLSTYLINPPAYLPPFLPLNRHSKLLTQMCHILYKPSKHMLKNYHFNWSYFFPVRLWEAIAMHCVPKKWCFLTLFKQPLTPPHPPSLDNFTINVGHFCPYRAFLCCQKDFRIKSCSFFFPADFKAFKSHILMKASTSSDWFSDLCS